MVWSSGITGTGIALPSRILTNADLEKMVDTSDEWIRTRTGIRERRIADADTTTADLAVGAAAEALANAGLRAAEVDLILVATVTADTIFPSTACRVQARLGAAGAAALDIAAGCSGFIYGLAVGAQFIATGLYRNVLVIGAETLSKITNWQDRSTCIVFGDGAGAAVLQPVEAGRGFLSFTLGADGQGGDLLSLPAGGAKLPASHATVDQGLHYIHMAGNEVYKFAVRVMGAAAVQALAKGGLTREDIDCLIPHQANLRIIEAAVKRLSVPMEKVFVNVDRVGNTAAASIAIALHEAVRAGRITTGDTVVLVGFGAGLTWGAAVLRW